MSADLGHKKIVIAGGSGFLGISMVTEFARAGADVTILSRSKPRVAGSWSTEVWDGRAIGTWVRSLDGVDALVNLAGRWSIASKKASCRTSVASSCGPVS